MAIRIQLRRDTAANWVSANPTLRAGEIGIETDTLKFKIGTGAAWNSTTAYANVTPSGLDSSLGDYIALGDQGNPGGPAELNSSGDLVVPENSIILWNDADYDYITTLTATQPTADRTITFPNATGTMALTTDIPSTTDGLSEGSTNKYFTDERAQDAVSTALSAGTHTNITVTYSDESNSISLAAAPGYVDEQAVDAVAAALAAGTHTNITVTYNDEGNSLSLAAAPGYTDEQAQDAIGNSLGTGLSYNDTTGAISVDTTAIQAKVANVDDTEIGYLNGVTSAIQTQLNDRSPINNPAFTGTVTLGGDPSSSLHAATKQYVDNTASGIVAKPQVLGATTANIDATYNNGTLGVGATLTHNTNGVFPAEAGGATGWAVGKGILVKNQTNKAHNGRYFISNMGSESTPYVLTRCSFCDEASEIPGAYIYVQAGTSAGTGWIQVVADPTTFVVGTDNIDVYQFSGSGTYTAGTGLTLTGNEYSINTSVTADLSTAQTLTNKTLTSPKINEDVALTATATEINVLDGITSTTAELNILDGVTSTAAELNILDGVTSTAAELNILDGATLTTTELNYVDGVTSAIQTQLDGKVDESLFDTKGDILVASADNTPAKLPIGTNGYLLTANSSATNGLEWAAAPVSLPDQSGNSGEYLTTDGTTASWAAVPDAPAATPTTRGTVFGRTGTLYNVSLGENALPALTTGAANIAIGDFSQSATTDQISNIGIGYNTLIDLAEDSNLNVAIGTNALGGAGTLDGSNNVAIGGNSGYGGLTGSNNLLLGANAAPSNSTVSNEITLGDADVTRFRIPGIGIDIGKSSTLSSNSISTIDTTVLADFTSIEYMVSLKQGTKVRTSKVIVQNNGSSVDMTEFAITETGGVISGVAVSAAVSSTNAVLQLTVTDAASTNVTVKLSKVAL